MTYFNAELWNIHQLCVLQVFERKRSKSSEKKRENLVRVEMSDIIS